MMKIAVCCKFTPDTEDIRITGQGQVDLSSANWSVSEYDLQAIEAASRITEANGTEAVAVTVGPKRISDPRLTKLLMSRGTLSSLYRVVDDSVAEADVNVLAKILAAVVAHAGVDVAIFGEGSSDRYYRMTGAQVASELQWPCVTCVDKITTTDTGFIVERDLEDGVEVVEVSVPCVICVTSTINIPTLPAMKAVLAAGKKPVIDLTLEDLGLVGLCAALEHRGSEAPAEPDRLKMMLSGSPEEIAEELVKNLKQENLL
jgi:electron transfer flavoprotein alpha/beta subunit